MRADEAVKSHDSYRSTAEKVFNKTELAALTRNDPETFRDLVYKSEKSLEEAVGAQKAYSQPNTRFGRAARQTENSIFAFVEYAEAFSGIVDIMRAVDDQYGGVGYSTLSLLIAVSWPRTLEHF